MHTFHEDHSVVLSALKPTGHSTRGKRSVDCSGQQWTDDPNI
jgi:hypothetical protein